MTAKWRTKTGCLTCRKRRKKCDERKRGKGICTACVRNGITCIWPGQGVKIHTYRDVAVQDLGSLPTENESAPQEVYSPWSEDQFDPIATSEITSGPYQDMTNRENFGWLMRNSPFKPSIWHGSRPDSMHRHELFNFYATALCKVMIRRDAHPGFHDWTYTMAQALEHPCLMDILLACSAVQLARNRPELLQLAFSYYSSAVTKTRAKIAAAEIDGSEDWLLMLVCHLAIFERQQPESSSRAAVHLQGAVYLMSLKRAKVSESSLICIKPHQRLYAESVLYNTSFTAFLSPDISWLSDSNVWEQVGVFCNANPYPDSPESTISPLIGGSLKICYLVLEVSYLARRLPWDIDDCFRATRLRSELDAWLADSECDNYGEMSGLSWRSAKLFSFAADILLFKAMAPDISASHPRIRARVKQSLFLLKSVDLEGMYWNQHFCWPIAIIACALERSEDFLFLQHKLESQWERCYFGDVKRTANILEVIWAKYYGFCQEGRRLSTDSTEIDVTDHEHTIDLLLCPEGLSSVLSK